MTREVGMNYEVEMNNYDDHGALMASKVQAIALLEARVKKLELKNTFLRRLVTDAVESDPSKHVMGRSWHAAARGVA